MNFQCYNFQTFEEVDKTAWNDLVEKTGVSIFQSFEWSELWWRHFACPQRLATLGLRGGRGNLKIIEAFDGDDLVGIGPFCEINGVLNLLGGIDITDYEDVIVLTEYKDVFIENISLRLPLGYARGKRSGQAKYKYDFHFVPEGGNLTVLPNAKIEVEEVAPYVELPESFEDYINSLPRHDRQELKRKLRKLEDRDPSASLRASWKLEKAKNGEDIDDFIRLHKSSDTAKNKFMTEKMEKFFREMAKVFWISGKLDLNYLVVEGKRVASTFSFKEKDRILAYNAGFDVEYGYLSVGLLAHVYAIKEAIENGLKVYDFLRGDERYKYQLGATNKSLYHITTVGDIN